MWNNAGNNTAALTPEKSDEIKKDLHCRKVKVVYFPSPAVNDLLSLHNAAQ
jgi:hypothetical protein